MDKEDLEAWQDSQVTQWVRQRLLSRSAHLQELCQQGLFQATGLSPAEWAALQSRVAYDRGMADGIVHAATVDYEWLEDSDESE